MINDVEIKQLTKICDERGRIMHMLNQPTQILKILERYIFLRLILVVKGWHEHTKMTLNYSVISGMIKLVLIDNRKDLTYKKKQEILWVSIITYL